MGRISTRASCRRAALRRRGHKAIEKRLRIIPVRVEESEIGAIDITHDTESMWPDAMIDEYVKSELKSKRDPNVHYNEMFDEIQLERMDVRKAFPARGSLLTASKALKELISLVHGIQNRKSRNWEK